MNLSYSEESDNEDFPICSRFEIHIPDSSFIIKNKSHDFEEPFNLEKNDYEKSYNLSHNSIGPFSSTQKATKEFSHQDYKKNLIINKNTNIINNKNNLDIFSSSKNIIPSTFGEDTKNEENKDKKNKKKKNKCGRKRTRNGDNICEHNKFSDDNIRRKCKHLTLKSLLDFLNEKIKFVYNGKIGKGIFKKKLRILNQSQTSNANIEFNKNFLNKKLKEIFSENITGRLTSIPSEHNKLIINNLINEEDIQKRNYFKELFELDFIQCLKHFRGEKNIELLKGLKCFNEYKEEIIDKYKDEGNDYFNNLNYYINNYERIINQKRSRQSRIKDKKDN